MRNPLVIAAAIFLMLSPTAEAAQGRGNTERSERRAERARPPAPPHQPQAGPGRPRNVGPGDVLPPSSRGAQIRDFNRQRLREPPPGYDWVQVGPNIYLTQRSTGMVLEAIPGGY